MHYINRLQTSLCHCTVLLLCFLVLMCSILGVIIATGVRGYTAPVSATITAMGNPRIRRLSLPVIERFARNFAEYPFALSQFADYPYPSSNPWSDILRHMSLTVNLTKFIKFINHTNITPKPTPLVVHKNVTTSN